MKTKSHEDAAAALVAGSDLLCDVVQVAFGPHGSPVVMNSPTDARPELVTRGAVIARRMIEVEDSFINMGMLIARHVACRVEDAVGDGSTTALVIYRRLLQGAFRMRAAGASANELVSQIRDAATCADDSLVASTLPLDSEAAARAIISASGLGHDCVEAIITAVVGTGSEGSVEVVRAHGTAVEVELLEGFHARASIVRAVSTERLVGFSGARVLLSEDPWSDVSAFANVAKTVKAAGWSTLVVVAPSIGDSLRAAIENLSDPGLTVIAAEVGQDAQAVLPDAAAYLGVLPVAAVLGDDLASIPLDRLGTVRRGWVSRGRFGLVTGLSHPDASARAASLRIAAESADDPDVAAQLRMRAGILVGASGILHVPSSTDAETANDHARAASVLRSGQLALRSGVVPGGGAALATLEITPPTLGAELLRDALAQPARVLAARAGLEPTSHIEALRSRPGGTRFDCVTQEWVSEGSDSIVDSLEVLRTAVRIAVSAAVSAIGTSSLISVPRPKFSVTP